MKPRCGLTRRDFIKYSAGTVACLSLGPLGFGCSGGTSGGGQIGGYPIASEVFTTAEQQVLPVGLTAATPKINPSDVRLYAQYGYSSWQAGRACLTQSGRNLRPATREQPMRRIS